MWSCPGSRLRGCPRMGAARRGCACSTLGLLARDRALAGRTGSLLCGLVVPLVGWEGARAADRRRRRSAGRAGEAARPRPWESRAGATGLGSDGGEADGRGGGARGATRLGRDGASNCASCFQAPTEYRGWAGRGPGHAVGLRPPPRPLPALPDRSRHGTRPISARNRTDLDAAGSQPLRETTRSAQGPA